MNSDTPQTNEELIDAAHCAECGYEVVLADAMRMLERERDQLKRELSEAREESAYLRKSTEGHEKTIGDCHDELRKLRAQLLALSASYQRQRDALTLWTKFCGRENDEFYWNLTGEGEAAFDATLAALAVTPDVSMWKPIDSAPKDGTRILALWPYSKTQCWFETFWDDDESQGDKPGWYAPEWGCLLDGYNPTHWQPLPPPPTLQPDHQK